MYITEALMVLYYMGHPNLSARHGTSPSKDNIRDYQNNVCYCHALGCLPELGGKPLLLKTLHISDTEFGGIVPN